MIEKNIKVTGMVMCPKCGKKIRPGKRIIICPKCKAFIVKPVYHSLL